MSSSSAILRPFMRIPLGANMPGDKAKKTVSVTLSSELLEQARELNLNLSSLLAEAVAEQIRKQHRQAWLNANREAIDSVNQFVEEHGSFSQFQRSF